MNPISTIVGALAFAACCGPRAFAQDAAGFVELRASYLHGVEGTPWQLVQRVRPRFEHKLHERVLLSATIEAALAEGRRNNTVVRELIEASDLAPWLSLAGCEWLEPRNPFFGIDGPSDWLFVDRLYVDWYHPRFDLRVGRQALQWGSGQILNPTDPYPQVLFNEPWRPRAGVNAARLTLPFGDTVQVQTVLGVSDDFRRARLAVRGTLQAVGTDWSVIAAVRPETRGGLVGFDAKGNLGVGWWVEAAVVGRELVGDEGEPSYYETAVVGVDYSFPVFENLMFSAQYIRNGGTTGGAAGGLVGGGVGSLDLGLSCAGQSPFGAPAAEVDPFAPVFSGTDYASLLAAASFTQDLSVNAVLIQNLRDGTGLAVPTVSVRASGAVEVALSAQVPYALWGEGGELKPSPDSLQLQVPVVPDAEPITVDLSGLVPRASLILWTRASF